MSSCDFKISLCCRSCDLGGRRRLTFIYPVRLNGTICGALPGPSLLFLSISPFQSTKYLSTFCNLLFTPVNPKSSHTHPVNNPIIPSTIFLTLQGLKEN